MDKILRGARPGDLDLILTLRRAKALGLTIRQWPAYWYLLVLTLMVTGLAAAVPLCAGLAAAHAQQAPRTYRIGFVSSDSSGPQIDAFREALKELGYVERTHVIVETRFADGRSERIPALVAQVLRLKVDVLVVGSTPGALAAKRATTTVPIVFASLFDPVGAASWRVSRAWAATSPAPPWGSGAQVSRGNGWNCSGRLFPIFRISRCSRTPQIRPVRRRYGKSRRLRGP
jgi:hypothetical protein